MTFKEEVLHVLQHKLESDSKIILPSIGESMFPFIKNGDLCEFELFDIDKLKKGDIILYWTKTGELIAHRYFYNKPRNNRPYYFCKGDTNLAFDEPIERSNIIARLTFIKRKERKINVNNIAAITWGKIIILIPKLSGIVRAYLNKRSVSL
jgi:signal peptidase I